MGRLLLLTLLGAAPALALVGPVAAQQSGSGPVASVRPAEPPHPVGEYAGVAPGTANLAPRAPAPGEGSLVVTWPGFQARPDGASRFFVQTNGPVVTETLMEEGRIVILVKGTRIHLRNNRRWLETRFFNTPVGRARLERRRGDVAIVLSMRAQVQPRVSSQAGDNGYHYILIEFPPGNFAPEAPPEPSPEPQPQPGAPAPAGPEAPPGFGSTGGG